MTENHLNKGVKPSPKMLCTSNITQIMVTTYLPTSTEEGPFEANKHSVKKFFAF